MTDKIGKRVIVAPDEIVVKKKDYDILLADLADANEAIALTGVAVPEVEIQDHEVLVDDIPPVDTGGGISTMNEGDA